MAKYEHSIDLGAETIRFTDSLAGRSPEQTLAGRNGSTKPVLLFVHGVFVNGLLWRKVVAPLEGSYRCIVPTLALGAHEVPMTQAASRSPRGQARLIAELIVALDLRDVTLVGNDTGGALCQFVIAHHPERIARVILTNCDAFENFPPPLLRPVYLAAHIPGFVWVIAQLLRVPALQVAFARTVAKNVPEHTVLSVWFRAIRNSAGVRRDLAAFIRAVSARELQSAIPSLRTFAGRALIVWGDRDLFFPLRDAQRLTAAFRDATLVTAAGSRTFVPEDAPMVLAESIERFVAATAAV